MMVIEKSRQQYVYVIITTSENRRRKREEIFANKLITTVKSIHSEKVKRGLSLDHSFLTKLQVNNTSGAGWKRNSQNVTART